MISFFNSAETLFPEFCCCLLWVRKRQYRWVVSSMPCVCVYQQPREIRNSSPISRPFGRTQPSDDIQSNYWNPKLHRIWGPMTAIITLSASLKRSPAGGIFFVEPSQRGRTGWTAKVWRISGLDQHGWYVHDCNWWKSIFTTVTLQWENNVSGKNTADLNVLNQPQFACVIYANVHKATKEKSPFWLL